MPITLKQISGHLDQAKFRHELNEEHGYVLTGSRTEAYLNADGKKGVQIVIRPFDDGAGLAVFAPGIYRLPEGPNAVATLKALAHAPAFGRYVQFSWNPEDGTITATAEMPVADGEVTTSQLMTTLESLVEIIDICDPMFRTAIETGELIRPDLEAPQIEKLVADARTLSPGALARLMARIDKAIAEAEMGGEGPETEEL